MAAIRHSLHRDVFQPNDERLIGVVCVAKASKKKKTSFLCATVTIEKPIQATIYQVKKSDKDNYKKRLQWPLRELKTVDGKSVTKETAEFDLHFDRCYKWIASSVQERDAFISCLWKLCHRYLLRQKPNFTNVPENLLEECIQVSESAAATSGVGENGIAEVEDYEALSAREEEDLVKLMSQTQCSISNAEIFTEQLSRDLSVLDGTNVHTMMASEEGVERLMQMLQVAIDEATKIEDKLDSYDELLKNVRDNILMMEEKDSLIHVQNLNNQRLMEELENLIVSILSTRQGSTKWKDYCCCWEFGNEVKASNPEIDVSMLRSDHEEADTGVILHCINLVADHIVSQLDLSHKHQVALIDGDLVNPTGIVECITAAKALHEAMNAQIHPSLLKMAAVQEQLKLFEKFKMKFAQRVSRHLNNLFIHLGHDPGDTLSLHASELTLPKHNSCHRELKTYSELMAWLKIADSNSYNHLSKTYTASLKKLYEREIKDFFETARIILTNKSSVDKKGKASSSSQDLSSRANTKVRASLLGNESEHFGSELDINDKQKFDRLFEQMLSELEPVCLSEQKFCVVFFCLGCDMSSSMMIVGGQLSSASPFSKSNSEEHITASKKAADKQVSEGLRKMMGELFSALEPELLRFVDQFDKVDGFYSMYSLVRLSQHVMSAQDTGSFLSMTFANALVQAKRNFDKFMQVQIRSVEDAKASKKSKCGIIPFVSNFEDFATQAETVFKTSDRRTDLDKWYKQLIGAMFDSIPRIAAEHLKTPREVLKVSCLETEKKEAKQKYTDSLQAYVTLYFGRPLEKLNTFFEGVQTKVAQGVKEDEIGYQLAFSKQELRKVIKEYPGKEVRKGLDSLYKKVEKHLSDEGNLLQVVWRSMLEEFIAQYKYIESLIERCYPGSMIALEFTIDDILTFFSDIARSH
ncbi:Exocyst complex component 1 [Nymphon striatum]|nr:Exocyst complex component 1 [Nymphon striatum]